MPAQIGFNNDERNRGLVEPCDSGNGNNDFDHRTRRDTSGRRQQRRHVMVSDTSAASGGYSSGGSNSSSSSGLSSGRLTSSFGDVPTPMFPIFPFYRSVGTQTTNELLDGDANDDDDNYYDDEEDFRRYAEGEIDERLTAANDSTRSRALFNGNHGDHQSECIIDLAG